MPFWKRKGENNRKAARSEPEEEEQCAEERPRDRGPKDAGKERSDEGEQPMCVEESGGAKEEDRERRILLVGKPGGGKSSSGNTILGEKRFTSALSPRPVTQTCQKEERAEEWKGRKIVLIDLPAIFDANVQEAQKSQEIQRCRHLSSPGPHALVFVTQVGRFTQEDITALEKVEEVFGPEATRYMVVLFTRKEDLEGESLEDYVEESGNRPLQDLVRRCQGRCCAFNNKLTGEESVRQVEELLSLVEKVVKGNRNKPCPMEPPGQTKGKEAHGASLEEHEMGESASKRGKKDLPKPDESCEANQGIPMPLGESGGAKEEDRERRILLVGKPGGGKSSSGNTILGEKRFTSALSPRPVTQTCQKEERAEEWKGRKIVLIDLPAIFDANVQEAQKSQEIQRCRHLSSPGPHALVFVTQVGRFTQEDIMALEKVEEVFGPEATKYMVVLFTRKEDLEGESLEDYVEESGNRPLQDLVRRCQGRCCAFNNKLTGEESVRQVEELLSLVEKVVKGNRNKPCPMELPGQTKGKAAHGASLEEHEMGESASKRGKKDLPKPDESCESNQGIPMPLGESGGAKEEERERRILLVGKPGGGKSSSGNTILGKKRFTSALSSKPVTLTCQKEERAEEWKGRKISLIDLPAIFDANVQEAQKSQEIQRCRALASPGPHALVFVTQVGRFTQEDITALQKVEEVFGPEATRYMVVLFTRKEDLEGESLEDYVEESGNRPLQDLVQRCQGRCCAFNNKLTGEESVRQVEELLSLVEKVVKGNRNKPCPMEVEEDRVEAEQREEKMDTSKWDRRQ